MIEFFIALFGGAYYITKYVSDKHSHNIISSETDRIIKEHSNKYWAWHERVTDKQLEDEMTILLQKVSKSKIEEMLREAGWYEKITLYNNRDRERVLAMLMSVKGKIPRNCAGIGVPSSVHIERTPQEEEMNRQSYKMALFINDNLRKHGIDEKMYLKRSTCYNTLNSKSACIGGYYVWAPTLPLHPDIVDIK